MFNLRRICQIALVLTLIALVAGCVDERSRRGRRGPGPGEVPGVNNPAGPNNGTSNNGTSNNGTSNNGTSNNGPGPVTNNGPGPVNNEPGPVNNEPGPVNNEPGPVNNEPGPGNNEPGPVNNEPGPVNNEPGPVNNEPGPGNNEPGPVNNDPGPVNNDPGPVDPDLELCEDYCHLVYGCVLDECSLGASDELRFSAAQMDCVYGNTQTGQPSCMAELAGLNGAEYRASLRQFVYRLDSAGNPTRVKNTCAVSEYIRCGQFTLLDECNCRPPTNLGGSCMVDSHCGGGSLDGVCLTESSEPRFRGGYCLGATCKLPDAPEDGQVLPGRGCGPDGVCMGVPTTTGGMQGMCFAGCTTGSCRSGYGCQPVGYDPSGVVAHIARACMPACTSDFECPDASRCNAHGGCEPECDGDMTMLCHNSGGVCQYDASRGAEYCVLP